MKVCIRTDATGKTPILIVTAESDAETVALKEWGESQTKSYYLVYHTPVVVKQ